MLRLIFATVFLFLLTFLSLVSVLSWHLVFLYFIMSLVTFVFFAFDKQASITSQRRIRETTLFLLTILCGWPGALFAQTLLRHKSIKPSFIRISLALISFNLILLLLFIYQA